MYIWNHNYTDYNGNPRTEDFYFNLSKGECLEMEMSVDGGMTSYLQNIINAQSRPQLFAYFKNIVLKAYGKKSLDGRQFIKSEELSREFSQTEAFSDLMILLTTNAEESIKFCKGIIPTVPAS